MKRLSLLLLCLAVGCGSREYIEVSGTLVDKRFTKEWVQPNWIFVTNSDGSMTQIYSPIYWPDKCEVWFERDGTRYYEEVGCASPYFALDRGQRTTFWIPKPKEVR